MNTRLIYHDQGQPGRIANKVVSVLSELPYVRRVALFGSLAENRADDWSDVDMQVACDNVEYNQWVVSSTIKDALPVLYYRRFGAVEPPAGRYWFAGESPFHKLDLGFVSIDEYETWKISPGRSGRDITIFEVYASDSSKSPNEPVNPSRFFEPASAYETEVGSYLYFSIQALKKSLRGECVQEKDLVRIAKLRELLPSISPDTIMSGGRIGELVYQVYTLLNDLHLGY